MTNLWIVGMFVLAIAPGPLGAWALAHSKFVLLVATAVQGLYAGYAWTLLTGPDYPTSSERKP